MVILLIFYFRRGQLGHGDLLSSDQPQLLDMLDGLKIICVAAGGWHSAAVTGMDSLTHSLTHSLKYLIS